MGKTPSRVSFRVPRGYRGFFVVPNSKALPPGGRYRLEVPLDRLCATVPYGWTRYEPSRDDRGAVVPYGFEEDSSGRAIGDVVWAIDFLQIEDSRHRGEVYFLGTREELDRALPRDPMAGEFKLGLTRRTGKEEK